MNNSLSTVHFIHNLGNKLHYTGLSQRVGLPSMIPGFIPFVVLYMPQISQVREAINNKFNIFLNLSLANPLLK